MSNPPDRPVPPPSFPPLETPAGTEPVYANLARISHTPAELTLDFARLLPGDAVARVVARLLMSPIGAKLFYRALGENLASYEASFGEIHIPGDTNLADELFRPVRPPDPPNQS